MLANHIPTFMSSLKEFQRLFDTLDIELDQLRNDISTLQSNQFINAANSEWLTKYEDMFNVNREGDLDVRRFNIISKLNAIGVFTYRSLCAYMDSAIGSGGYSISLNGYSLTIEVPQDKQKLLDPILNYLRNRIPSNIALNINTSTSIGNDFYTGVFVRTLDDFIVYDDTLNISIQEG